MVAGVRALVQRVADEGGTWFVAGVRIHLHTWNAAIRRGFVEYNDADLLTITEAGRAMLAGRPC